MKEDQALAGITILAIVWNVNVTNLVHLCLRGILIEGGLQEVAEGTIVLVVEGSCFECGIGVQVL